MNFSPKSQFFKQQRVNVPCSVWSCLMFLLLPAESCWGLISGMSHTHHLSVNFRTNESPFLLLYLSDVFLYSERKVAFTASLFQNVLLILVVSFLFPIMFRTIWSNFWPDIKLVQVREDAPRLPRSSPDARRGPPDSSSAPRPPT